MWRCGKQKLRVLSMLAFAIVITSLVTSIAYAYAAYHGNWPEQPYWGNWWWYNYGYLYWDVDDLWTPSGVNALRSGHNNFPWKEYRFEQEAYNPGLGTSCDRLKVSGVTHLPCRTAFPGRPDGLKSGPDGLKSPSYG